MIRAKSATDMAEGALIFAETSISQICGRWFRAKTRVQLFDNSWKALKPLIRWNSGSRNRGSWKSAFFENLRLFLHARSLFAWLQILPFVFTSLVYSFRLKLVEGRENRVGMRQFACARRWICVFVACGASLHASDLCASALVNWKLLECGKKWNLLTFLFALFRREIAKHAANRKSHATRTTQCTLVRTKSHTHAGRERKESTSCTTRKRTRTTRTPQITTQRTNTSDRAVQHSLALLILQYCQSKQLYAE